MPKPSLQTVLIVLTAVLASLLEIVDLSIVNVAIPHMMGNLGATLEDISWVVTGYALANAIVLPIAGWLGLQIGRRLYYTSCILIFAATSVGCGFAPNLGVLIFFRVLQGLAGGALLPTSQALIQETFPGKRAGMGSAIFGMSIMVGPTLGPTLGGYLTDTLGWRSIFNINLPIGLIAAALAWANVTDYGAHETGQRSQKAQEPNAPGQEPQNGTPALSQEPTQEGEKKRRQRIPIDGWGLLFLVVGVGALQYFLERGEADDWFDSNGIRLAFFLAITGIPAFIWRELRAKFPIMDLHLFREKSVRYGTLLMLEVGNILYMLVFLLPIFCAQVLGLTATQIGELFIPGALMSAAMMPLIGFNLRKGEARHLVLIGIGAVEVALFMMMHLSSQSSADDLFFPLLIRGAAMGFLFVPINTAVLSQFKGYQLGQVAGMLNLFRQIGGSIGIALAATMLRVFQKSNYNSLGAHVSRLNPLTYHEIIGMQGALRGKLSTATGFVTGNTGLLKFVDFRIQMQSYVISVDQVFAVTFFLFLLAVLPTLMLRMPKHHEGPLEMH